MNFFRSILENFFCVLYENLTQKKNKCYMISIQFSLFLFRFHSCKRGEEQRIFRIFSSLKNQENIFFNFLNGFIKFKFPRKFFFIFIALLYEIQYLTVFFGVCVELKSYIYIYILRIRRITLFKPFFIFENLIWEFHI